jgi:hypothetical protein
MSEYEGQLTYSGAWPWCVSMYAEGDRLACDVIFKGRRLHTIWTALPSNLSTDRAFTALRAILFAVEYRTQQGEDVQQVFDHLSTFGMDWLWLIELTERR